MIRVSSEISHVQVENFLHKKSEKDVSDTFISVAYPENFAKASKQVIKIKKD